MRGYADGNFPAFDRQERVLKEQGWEVINPANLDRTEGCPPNGHENFDPASDYDDREFMREALGRDCKVIREDCTAMYMMSRWEQSRGAKAEWHIAKALGLEIYYEAPLPNEKD